MTVKELREFLEGKDDELEVVFCDKMYCSNANAEMQTIKHMNVFKLSNINIMDNYTKNGYAENLLEGEKADILILYPHHTSFV